MNLITKLLGLNLKSKISAYKKNYKSNRQLFDYTQVRIFIDESENKFYYNARCICNDVFAQGLSSNPSISVFHSQKFKTQIEAEADLEKQVRYASQKLNDTDFYKTKKIIYFGENGLEDNVSADFKYSNSEWVLVDPL